jgi:hypothetical protein
MQTNCCCLLCRLIVAVCYAGTANLAAHPSNKQACLFKVKTLMTTMTGLAAGSSRPKSTSQTFVSEEGIARVCRVCVPRVSSVCTARVSSVYRACFECVPRVIRVCVPRVFRVCTARVSSVCTAGVSSVYIMNARTKP